MYTIRKEGYIPQTHDEQSVTFKVQRSTFNINLFSGESTYKLVNIHVLFHLDRHFAEAEMSAMRIMLSSLLAKIIVDREDECIIFSFSSYCTSVEEFENLFPNILSLLLHKIDEHTELFYSLLQDKLPENTTSKRTMGFKTTPISDSKN